MAITSRSTYHSYFRKLSWQNKLLRGSFIVGDSWRIIAQLRSRITYPVLWLERPQVSYVFSDDGDTLAVQINGALSILGGAATDDYEKQDYLTNQAETIAGQLIARMKKEADENAFDLVLPINSEPVATLMSDDDHGVRLEFQMLVRQWTGCYHADDWTLTVDGEENLPLEDVFVPHQEETLADIDPTGTQTDFSIFYHAVSGLTLSDTTTYIEGDRRRDITFTITDGTTTVTATDWQQVLPDDELADLDAATQWTITMTVKTMAGGTFSKTHIFIKSNWL